jgi:hypothetical protein
LVRGWDAAYGQMDVEGACSGVISVVQFVIDRWVIGCVERSGFADVSLFADVPATDVEEMAAVGLV